ncbi:MAG: class II SORL domain-containing protein [Nitrospirae bacterium]|nr:class II SORL domain-containing protein [Nitrospirota bacterium]
MTEKGYFCGINKPKDLAAMTDFEKKHTPLIDCPDTVVADQPFTVKLKVGELPHVTEEGHFIQWAEVKFGENLYARIEFSPVLSVPEATVTLKKSSKHSKGTLRVLSKCNLHGLWEASKEITITAG